MSNYDINSNPRLVAFLIEESKKSNEEYFKKNPDSLILRFEQELRELGYEFEIHQQIIGFLPKHKATILPIAIRYYEAATLENEKNFFMSLFNFKGFEEVVPLLLRDFYSNGPLVNRWWIADRLLTIRSKRFVDDYVKIISDSEYGQTRAMVILLVGKLKVEQAIPILIKLLDDDEVRSHAICALGDYKREEFKPYFERFINDKNSYFRKYATGALKKLDNVRVRGRIKARNPIA